MRYTFWWLMADTKEGGDPAKVYSIRLITPFSNYSVYTTNWSKEHTVNSILIYPHTPTFHYSSLVPTYSDRGCLIEIPRLRSLYILNLPRINFKYRNIFPAFLVHSQIRKSIPLPGPSLRTLPKSAHHRPFARYIAQPSNK
jgi:hypothetical protein